MIYGKTLLFFYQGGRFCKKISYKPDLFSNSYICECSFHFDLPPKLRLDSLFDSNYEIINAPDNINPDPLGFEIKDGARDGYKYIGQWKNGKYHGQGIFYGDGYKYLGQWKDGKYHGQDIFT